MKKQVKTIEKIYGDYVDKMFAEQLRELSHEALQRATFCRNDRANEDIHHKDLNSSVEAVEFWGAINAECREYLKEVR